MACYHPFKSWIVGTYDSVAFEGKGKEKKKVLRTKKLMKFSPFSVDGREVKGLVLDHGDYVPYFDDIPPKDKPFFDVGYELPCGQCIGCRLDYSRTWANRLMMELSLHDPSECWFLTLTYDNDHLDTIISSHSETGEVTLSLNKRDVQLFHKRLREAFPRKNLRFFYAGEYGERTMRPHGHGIYFSLCLDGFDPSDSRNIWSRTEQGFTLYHWPRLDEIWSNGRVIIAPVSWDTCAYTARYVTKKLTGPAAEAYQKFGIIPEFSLMSRKPGIARGFFEQMVDFDPRKRIYLSTSEKGLNFSPPRYFKDIWKLDNELEYDIIGLENGIKIRDTRELRKQENSLARQDWLKYLESCEESHRRGALSLSRSDN